MTKELRAWQPLFTARTREKEDDTSETIDDVQYAWLIEQGLTGRKAAGQTWEMYHVMING